MKSRIVLWISSGIITLLLVFNACTKVVEEGTVALLLRFGRVATVREEPGLIFKWPWPIDKVEVLETRKKLFQSKNEQVLTRDQNSLVVANHVIWSIVPASASLFYERLQTVEAFEVQLESKLRSLRNGILGAVAFTELFDGSGKLDELEIELKASLSEVCHRDFGVSIDSVGYTHLGLSTAVLESVYEKMNAERQNIVTRLRGDAEAEADSIKTKAQSDYDKEMAAVEGEVQRIIGQAEADSIEAFRELSKHKDLALRLKKLESLEALLKGRSTIVLDRQTPPLDILNKETP